VIVRVAPESEPENYLGIASGALIRKGSRSPLGQLPGNDPNDPNNPGNDPNNPGNPDDGSEAGGIEE
jgi:hypothetical protein